MGNQLKCNVRRKADGGFGVVEKLRVLRFPVVYGDNRRDDDPDGIAAAAFGPRQRQAAQGVKPGGHRRDPAFEATRDGVGIHRGAGAGVAVVRQVQQRLNSVKLGGVPQVRVLARAEPADRLGQRPRQVLQRQRIGIARCFKRRPQRFVAARAGLFVVR